VVSTETAFPQLSSIGRPRAAGTPVLADPTIVVPAAACTVELGGRRC